MRAQTAILSGLLYYYHGYYKEALEKFECVDSYYLSARKFRDDWVCGLVSTCYYKMQDYDSAIEYLTGYLDDAQLYDISVIHDRAFYYMVSGRYEEAMADYERARQMNPSLAKTYFGKCAVLYKQGKQEEAKEEYSKVIEIDPAMECLEYNEVLQEMVTKFSKSI